MSDVDGYSDSSQGSDSELDDQYCFCGLRAKQRMSHTEKNPDRLFYNCPRKIGKQCDYFCWCDDDEPTLSSDSDVDELEHNHHDCCNQIHREYMDAKAKWQSEKEELVSKLRKVEAELNDLKRRVKAEPDLKPPVDPLWCSVKVENEDHVWQSQESCPATPKLFHFF